MMSDEAADMSNKKKSFRGDPISRFDQNSQRRVCGILPL